MATTVKPKVTTPTPVTSASTTATPPPTTTTAPPTTTAQPAATFDAAKGKANALIAAAGGMPALTARLGKKGINPALLAKLQADPAALKGEVEKYMAALVASDGATFTKKQEKELFRTLATLQAAGQLRPALGMLAQHAAQNGALPAGMPKEKVAALVEQLASMIDAEIAARGANGSSAGVFPSWQKLSKQLLRTVRKTAVPPQGPGHASAFTNEKFLTELQKDTGSTLRDGNRITPLIDGPASFAERDRLIDGATTSIHLMSWAIYDDDTGWETAKKLVAKHKNGIDVRVMVDGNVAREAGHDKVLAYLEQNGIDVVRWNDPDRPHDGSHRKIMVVDGNVAVAGGMNIGDVYSHRGQGKAKWRDTDVTSEGRVVQDAAVLFVKLWNEQVQTHKLAFTPIAPPQAVPPAAMTAPAARTMLLDDTPGPNGNANVMLAVLKSIEGATTSLDIENAYLISTPALQDALLAALKRGVRVRILTNSAESIDEPIVTAPILKSLPALITAGAEVYVKKGDTLHSKFLVVDGLASIVGSYNLHPRSERYEGEDAFLSIDNDAARILTQAFEADIAAATRFAQASDVHIPTSPLTILAMRLFFDLM